MDSIHDLDLDPGPDGNPPWPDAFAADSAWITTVADTWAPVPNHPRLHARRDGDRLHLHADDHTVHTYRLTKDPNLDAHIATKETP